MKILISLLLFFTFFLGLFAQEDSCSCCDDMHAQFDFWIGQWAVYDTLNNLVGTNEIVKEYGNCLIRESWVSKGANRGTSYNYYDPSDSTWNQLWIDNQGTILKLKGNYVDEKMILKSDLKPGKKVDWYYNRISWQKLDNGNVKQVWDVLNKENVLLANLFTGIYKPKPSLD